MAFNELEAFSGGVRVQKNKIVCLLPKIIDETELVTYLDACQAACIIYCGMGQNCDVVGSRFDVTVVPGEGKSVRQTVIDAGTPCSAHLV
jgi:hypothetical protein